MGLLELEKFKVLVLLPVIHPFENEWIDDDSSMLRIGASARLCGRVFLAGAGHRVVIGLFEKGGYLKRYYCFAPPPPPSHLKH
jgi:hypothetical protein